jgi:phosphate starvation-inducible PhoH-like protein
MARPKKVTPEFEAVAPVSRTAKKVLSKEELLTNIRLSIKCKNETQKKLINTIKDNDVTICTGVAGTGKTLISVYEALTLFKAHPNIYKEIKLVKSITQLKNEELGTLPGDEKDKLKFHMMSFLDAFHKLIGEDLTNKLIESGLIKMEVFGAIRGRSFTNSIIIIDEFQNISKDNAKTFLTRFSEDTKVIVLGDSGQIDLKNKKDSALEPLVNKVKNKPVEGVDIVVFDKSDVVRHRLTSYFIDVFEEIIADDEPKNRLLETNPKATKPKPLGQGNYIGNFKLGNKDNKITWLRKLKIFFKRRFK